MILHPFDLFNSCGYGAAVAVFEWLLHGSHTTTA
jgi:hypothetical protein